MYYDEREDTLREVAALGNAKAVQQLAHSGVNLNSQNKMNGWTALHWAAHRGNANIVSILLRSGADPSLKTVKGQNALDLGAKHQEVVDILKKAMNDAEVSVGPEPELPIVPTYMKNPDLEKTWLMPEEFSENKVENIVRKQKAAELLNEPATTKQPTVQAVDSTSGHDDEKEILIYMGSRSDENLVGSVFLKNESIESALVQIREEIDGLPDSFSLARNNGKVSIPINPKQYSKRLLDLFRSQDDVLIVIPLFSIEKIRVHSLLLVFDDTYCLFKQNDENGNQE